MFDRREHDLLNAIEDAERKYKLTKKRFRLSAFLGIPLALAMIGGGTWIGFWGTLNHIDTGGPAAPFIALGILLLIGSIVGTIGFYFIAEAGNWNYHNEPALADTLRKAQRAHMAYLGGL